MSSLRCSVLRRWHIGVKGSCTAWCPAAKLAMALRPNDAMVMYNVACVFGQLGKKAEALDALRKALEGGWGDADWARRDPDLALLHGDPEFDRMYPPTDGGA